MTLPMKSMLVVLKLHTNWSSTRHTKIIMVTKTLALAKLEDQKQVFSKTSL